MNNLQKALHKADISINDQLLIILAHSGKPLSTKEVRAIAEENGVKKSKKLNLSSLLSRLHKKIIKLPEGWIINDEGLAYIKKNNLLKTLKTKVQKDLELELENIKSEYVKAFVAECVTALEHNLLRSAIVFSWIGAISILYEYVEKSHLNDFNTAAKARFKDWKDAKNVDGLCNMKESNFLQVITDMNLIGKSTKKQLEQCLDKRNSCGHPSSFTIGPNIANAHVEILIKNVYEKF